MTPKYPDELKKLAQWMPYKLTDRGNGSTGKKPCNRAGIVTDATAPRNFMSFGAARDVVKAGRADGIGFCQTNDDPYVTVDLDDAVENGRLKPCAEKIVKGLNSLTELSPSGNGVHVWTRGKLPPDAKTNNPFKFDGQKVELKRAGYLTVTGHPVPGYPGTINDAQSELDRLWALKSAAEKAPAATESRSQGGISSAFRPTHQQVIQKILADDDSRALWEDKHPDKERSEADYALIREITYFAGDDEDLTRDVFLQSPLAGRDKTQNRIGDYVNPTIRKCLDQRRASGKFYAWPGQDSQIDRRRLLSLEELDALPDPKFAVQGILTQGGQAGIYGPPESLKTFLGLELGMCMATGEKVLGRFEVPRVLTVVYISPEGTGGLRKRVAAWKQDHGVKSAPMYFCLDAFRFVERGEVDSAVRMIREAGVEPDVIFIDTLAQNMGGDENGTRDMSTFCANCYELGRRFDHAAVVVIHHTGKDESRGARGNGAFRAALDTEIEIVRKKDGTAEVRCTKQKDFPHFEPFHVRPKLVGDSLVLEYDSAAEVVRKEKAKLLPILRHVPRVSEPPLTASEILESVEKADPGLTRENLYHHLNRAADDFKYVKRHGKKGSFRYSLTETGTDAVSVSVSEKTPGLHADSRAKPDGCKSVPPSIEGDRLTRRTPRPKLVLKKKTNRTTHPGVKTHPVRVNGHAHVLPRMRN